MLNPNGKQLNGHLGFMRHLLKLITGVSIFLMKFLLITTIKSSWTIHDKKPSNLLHYKLR